MFLLTITGQNITMINLNEIQRYSRPKWSCVRYKVPESAKIHRGYYVNLFTIINLLEIQQHNKHVRE